MLYRKLHIPSNTMAVNQRLCEVCLCDRNFKTGKVKEGIKTGSVRRWHQMAQGVPLSQHTPNYGQCFTCSELIKNVLKSPCHSKVSCKTNRLKKKKNLKCVKTIRGDLSVPLLFKVIWGLTFWLLPAGRQPSSFFQRGYLREYSLL